MECHMSQCIILCGIVVVVGQKVKSTRGTMKTIEQLQQSDMNRVRL